MLEVGVPEVGFGKVELGPACWMGARHTALTIEPVLHQCRTAPDVDGHSRRVRSHGHIGNAARRSLHLPNAVANLEGRGVVAVELAAEVLA